MTAFRRMMLKSLCGAAAVMALASALPAAAQNSEAPVDVTAAPPPSSETVGPAQLRNFSLQGTVTRPSDRPAATAAQPVTTASAAPGAGEAVPSEVAAGPATPNSRRGANVATSGTAQSSPTGVATDPSALSQPITPSLPLEVTTDPAPQPGFGEAPETTSASLTPSDATAFWPWLAALIALIGGGAFIAWSRRNRHERYGDPGRMAFAGLAPDVVGDNRPIPPAKPKPDAVPPPGQPSPAGVTGWDLVPKPASDGLIVSTRLKPELSVQFMPDRVVITGAEVILQFDVIISNAGSAPARDVLVEGRLFTAHPAQDRDIANFFQNPIGSGDRIPAIDPLGKLSLKSAVRLTLDQIHSFEVESRRLFVPLVGFNILFRSNSGEGQVSASFLVGRGNEDDEKLAPFRFDLGPRIFRGLSARSHSMGLQPA